MHFSLITGMQLQFEKYGIYKREFNIMYNNDTEMIANQDKNVILGVFHIDDTDGMTKCWLKHKKDSIKIAQQQIKLNAWTLDINDESTDDDEDIDLLHNK